MFRTCLAVLILSAAAALSAAPLDLTDPAVTGGKGVSLFNRTGRVKVDRLGVWNVWPDYTGIRVDEVELDGAPADFEFTFSPADTALAWLDGHLFSLADASGNEVLRLDMVRRGRFRLAFAGNKAVSRPQKWDCTVVNWDNLAPRKLTVRLAPGGAALLMDGRTVVKLDGPMPAPGSYRAFLGQKDDVGRGALGWYSSFERKPAPAEFPEPQPLPGKPEWSARVDALERLFITPEMDRIPFDKDRVRAKDARIAAIYIAVDGLWYRLLRGLTPGFEFFLDELEKLTAAVRAGELPDEVYQVGGGTPPDRFLTPGDTDFYYGDCGWGLAAYAPELARLGVNLVSEHIWPEAVLDAQGKPRDVMLIRRTMPQLEEFEKYNIAFDLMIAPYTPNCLLKKHPEWEGAFFGLGTESEAENLKRQTEEWKGRQAGHGFLKASVIAPDYREMCRTFLEYLLAFVRNSRMLVAIDLANEVLLEDYSPLMQQYFRDWLRRKYGSAEKLNAAWRSNYASIDDVLMVRPLVFDRTHPVRFWDWVLCNREAGTGHFRFLHELCRRNAPGVPTHVKHLPHEFGTPWYEMGSNARNFYDYADGIDRKALAGLTEIIGTDSWADNAHDESGRLSSDVPMQSAYFSLLRSYQPEKWIFDSEWHILRCDPPATPPACLDMVMQQNAVHGLRAGTFWLVCPGNGQHLELSSTAPLMLQSGLTGAKIRSKREYFNALASRPRRFGVLYSPKSRYVGGDLHSLRLLRYFEAGMFSGAELRIVDERQLIGGEVTARDLDLLVVLDTPLPMEETPAALRKFAADGGKLILYGDFATRLADVDTAVPFLRRERATPSQDEWLRRIRRDAAEFGLAAPVDVTDEQGRPVYGVEWHVGRLADGRRVLYIANMSKETRKLKLSGVTGLIDTDTGKAVPAGNIELPNWGTFIGICR